MALSRPFTLASRSRSSTPALRAAEYISSSKMSHPVKTRSFSLASGTNSLILGKRPSVRLPSRMVPIWVRDPIGLEIPLRTASTPATNVVATAPIPGTMIPSLPLAGASAFLPLLLLSCVFPVGIRISPFLEASTNLLSSRIQSAIGKPLRLNGIFSPFVGDCKDLAEKYERAQDRSNYRKLQRHRIVDRNRVCPERLPGGRYHARLGAQRPPRRSRAKSRRPRQTRPAPPRCHRVRLHSRSR